MGFGDTASQHSAGSGNRNPRSSYRRVKARPGAVWASVLSGADPRARVPGASVLTPSVACAFRRVANGSSVDDTLFGKKKEATIAPKQEKVTLTLANILPGVRATVSAVFYTVFPPRRALCENILLTPPHALQVETRVAPGAISNAQRTARLGATASKDESHVVLSTSDLVRGRTSLLPGAGACFSRCFGETRWLCVPLLTLRLPPLLAVAHEDWGRHPHPGAAGCYPQGPAGAPPRAA